MSEIFGFPVVLVDEPTPDIVVGLMNDESYRAILEEEKRVARERLDAVSQALADAINNNG